MSVFAGLIAEMRRAMRVSADAERLMHNTERLERAVAAFVERHRRVKDERDRALADLAEVRAVLAPLLAQPYTRHAVLANRCLFCRRFGPTDHEPACPVLRADALLGRGAGQPGEEKERDG